MTLRLVIAIAIVFVAAEGSRSAAAAAPAPATAPTAAASRPASVDDATWQRMLDIDRKAAAINDLSADFEQRKFTAMLKKPLVSGGAVRVRGAAMLWETRRPEPNALRIDAREVRIYYPAQKTIEVYQVQQKLGQLAASPLPRLAVLLEHFTFGPLELSDFGETDHERYLALRMKPVRDELREHIDEVRVLLDAASGLIVRFEMRDADGDRTLISFSNAKTNVGLGEGDLQIAAPADVNVTRPLAAVEGSPPQPQQGQTGAGSK